MNSDPRIENSLLKLENIGKGSDVGEDLAMNFFWNYKPWGFQKKFHESSKPIRAAFCGNRVGKCKKLTSPVLMANGKWKPLGDIIEGDKVIGHDYKSGEAVPSIVTQTSRAGVKDIYRFTFRDGGFVEGSPEHHFPVKLKSGRQNKVKKVRVSELLKRDVKYVGGCIKFQQPKVTHFKYQSKPLPVHPYLLGVLVGDGSLSSGNLGFTSKDKVIVDRVTGLCSKVGIEVKKFGKIDYRLPQNERNEKGRLVNHLKDAIKKLNLNVTSKDKFIPEIYKSSSVEDRKQLLAGLIDTDGSYKEFVSKSEQLVDDFCFIAKSLGGRAIKKIKIINSKFTHFKDQKYYRVYWRFNYKLPLSLDYKQKITKRPVEYNNRFVEKIEYMGKFQCGDIAIDHPRHCYISDDFISTGNTTCGVMEMFIQMTGKLPHLVKDWYPKEKIAKPNAQSWICCSSDSVEKVILPKIRECIPFKSFDIEWISSKNEFRLPDGKRIYLKTYEQGWQTFQGAGIHFILNDEEFQDEQIYKEELARILSTKGRIAFTMTPLSGKTWVYYKIYEPSKNPGSNIDVFSANMHDAPHLSEDTINWISQEWPEHEREARVKGEFIVAPEKRFFNPNKVHEFMKGLVDYSDCMKIWVENGELKGTIDDLNLPLDTWGFPRGGMLEGDKVNPQGAWKIWEQPKKGYGYILGVDVGSGEGSQPDHSVIHVKRRTKLGVIVHCATMRSNCIKPYELGRISLCGARFYNDACIVAESEGIAAAFFASIEFYPHLWRGTRHTGESKNGIAMTGKRPKILENERDLVERSGMSIINEYETLEEMTMFVYTDKTDRWGNFKPDHVKGERSDGIMASSLADYILVEHPTVINDNAKDRNIRDNVVRRRYDDFKIEKPRFLGNKRRVER